MKNISACRAASGWLVACLLLALHLHLQAQGFTYPKQMDEVYVGVTLNRLTFDARASLHNPVRFVFPTKALTFADQPQPKMKYSRPKGGTRNGVASGAVMGFFTGLAVGLILENRSGTCHSIYCPRVAPGSTGFALGILGTLPRAIVGGIIGTRLRNKKVGDTSFR